MRKRTAATTLTITLMLASIAATQTPAKLNLADYVGTYADKSGQTIELIAGDALLAVIDEAEYPLRPSGPDEFLDSFGTKIPFRRDASGAIVGYKESGEFHPRISTTVTATTAALAHPRASDGPYQYHAPGDLHDGIATGDIAQTELGKASADAIVQDVLDGTYKGLHSVLLYQHGKLVLEEYFYGYTAARTQQLRSATKSVVSAVAGIALDRGALRGVDEPILPHLGYTDYANPDPQKAKITLGNFLSMSSGLDCNDHSSTSPGRETVIDEAPDWVKATLDLPMINPPGTHGFYCSGGVAVVGRTVENAVHMPLPEYAQAYLFTPLGIARSDWKWNYNLTNADKEYSQIHLRPRDMLKLGILFASDGKWQGHQVISSSWVHASLAQQSTVENTSYGYFWWRPYLNVPTPTGVQRVDMIAAQGNGGQKIYILPQYDLVAVFTGGNYNADGTPPNKIMARIILPTLIAASHQHTHEPEKP